MAAGAVRVYLDLFPEDRPRLVSLMGQMDRGDDILSRKNFTGHITASALVVNESAARVLLIFHRALGRLLQPGGHIEPGDGGVADAARRELIEETGLAACALDPWHARNASAPLHIETHGIPSRPEKGEPEHVHHDCLYLFTASDAARFVGQIEEVQAVGWWDLASASVPGRLRRAVRRAQELSLMP